MGVTGRSLLCAGLLLLAGGCGDDGGTADVPRADAPGARIVTETDCLSCHALGSEGNETVGGTLNGIGAKRSRAELQRLLAEPPPGMPAYTGRLSGAEQRELVDYLAGLR